MLDDGEAEAVGRRIAACSPASSCRNRSNTCGRNSREMPAPVSRTMIEAWPSALLSSRTSTRPSLTTSKPLARSPAMLHRSRR